MIRFIALFIALASLLAIANAALVYKRSTYFENPGRVNLEVILENAGNLEKDRLLELNNRLARMSDADFGTLNLISAEFRRAIIYLIISLTVSLIFISYLLLLNRHND